MAATATSRAPARGALMGALGLGLSLLTVAALLYTTATSANWLAERAETLAGVDVAVTDLEVAQNRVGQSLLLGTELEAGITSEEVLAAAVDEARLSLERLEQVTRTLGNPELTSGAYVDSAEELLDAVGRHDLEEARRLTDEVSSGYSDLSGGLVSVRAALAADIGRARSWGGVAATVTGVILALAVPVAMVIVYRLVARRQLRRAELESKLAAEQELSRTKDEFIANISHELRTPLTGIYGFAQVLEEGSLYDPETALELVNLIIAQAGELNRMVDDLLTAARAKAGVLSYELSVIQPEPEIAEVVTAFERMDGPIPLFIEHVPVVADPLRLRQVLRNLLANARKHGGPNVQLIGQRTGDRYEVAVMDDGAGVPDHLFGTIFERFMHSGNTPLLSGSVGLGLHIARTLARGMDGDLEYRRKEGLTQFVLSLSLAPAVPAAESTTSEVAHA